MYKSLLLAAACAWSFVASEAMAATLAGTTTGQFQVSAGGTATYRIPIEVPPGTAGLRPRLALKYTHNGENGLVGVGWQVDGLSQISRCPATYAQDGFYDGVDYDANDRLCLGGKRLVAIDGSYGTAGAEYRTEIDLYTKVVQHGGLNGSNSWFEVYTKSGEIYEYGNGSGSFFAIPLASGGTSNYARAWSVNRIADTAGNYLEVTYENDASTHENYPTRIDYTGNDNAGLAPYNSVRFVYESRPDVRSSYFGIGSARVEQTRRLARIQSYAGNTVAREYRLSYDVDRNLSSARSRLTQILECGSGGLDCFDPTRFTWTDSNSETNGRISFDIQDEQNFPADPQGRSYVGDWNGDGLTDVMFHNPANGTNKWYVNPGTTLDAITDTVYADNPIATGMLSSTEGNVYLGDWNGDGITDLMWYRADNGTNRWWINNGDGTFSSVYTPIASARLSDSEGVLSFGDWNTDGLTDAMWYSAEQGINRWFVNDGAIVDGQALDFIETNAAIAQNDAKKASGEGRLYTGDWNGDGLRDAMFYDREDGDNRWFLADSARDRFDPLAFQSLPNAGIDQQDLISGGDGDFRFGDWNADGLVDVMWFKTDNGANRWWVNTGMGEMQETALTVSGQAIANSQFADGRLHFGDWNADGITDMAFYRNSDGTNRWYVNDGQLDLENVTCTSGNSCNGIAASSVSGSGGSWMFGDWRGNGVSDVMWYKRDAGQIKWFANDAGSKEHIVEIRDGLGGASQGAKITIDYAPLTDSAVYTPAADRMTGMDVSIQTPMYVVSSYASSAGGQSMATIGYRYKDFKVNLLGRGGYGFGEIVKTDEAARIVERTEYYNSWPKAGQKFQRQQIYYVPPSIALTSYSNKRRRLSYEYNWITPEAHNDTTTGVTRYKVFHTKNRQYKYDFGDSAPFHHSEREFEYDDYGNTSYIRQVDKALDASGNATSTIEKQTYNSYYNDTEYGWILARLDESHVGVDTDNGYYESPGSTFTYDWDTGFLLTETIEGGDTESQTTTYQRDVFGNKISATVTTSDDGQGRTESKTFDAKGRFPIAATNALGHTENRTYSPIHGGRLTLTGPNGQTTEWRYDAFGRQTRVINADGTFTQLARANCDIAQCPTATGVYAERTTESTGMQTLQVSDLSGNTVSQSQLSDTGTWIDTLAEFDSENHRVRQSKPHFRGDTPLWTAFEYDESDRVVEVRQPSGDGSGPYVTQKEYDRHTRRTIDANGNTSEKRMDAAGNLVQVTDALGHSNHYTHDGFGNVLEVEDAQGNITSMEYDDRNRKTYMYDYDMGGWSYDHNGYGELIEQTDAKGQVTTIEYDRLGRMTERTTPEGTDTWTYDNDWVGALDRVDGHDGFMRRQYYDQYGRVTRSRTRVDGDNYDIDRTYDNQSRVATLEYPHGLTVQRDYDAYGYLDAVSKANSSTVYWQASARDARGNLVEVALGNGHTTIRDYNPATGYLESVLTGTTLGTEAQSMSYSWDGVGNLLSRTDQNQSGMVEDFQYDALNRVTQATITQGPTYIEPLYVSYDSIGNIGYKSDVGEYNYGNRPHAVINTDGERDATYTYDANGNMLSGADRAFQWTSFNKPRAIVYDDNPPSGQFFNGHTLYHSNASAFFYAPDRSRYKQIRNQQTDDFGFIDRTVIYVGGIYEYWDEGNGKYEHRAHIQAGGETVVIRIERSTNNNDTNYIHRDHLGSVTAVSDSAGTVVEQFVYDAFGKRRFDDWTEDPYDELLFGDLHDPVRGFTGHEHLDNVGLIHMNGRVYDPILGRFTSPDTFVQFPESTQGFNRYTYVNNNPLSYTDPSGHFLDDIVDAVEDFVSDPVDVIGSVLNPTVALLGYQGEYAAENPRQAATLAAAAIPGVNVYVAAAVGFGAGFIASGGDIKAGLYSAATAAAFYGAGQVLGAAPGASATLGEQANYYVTKTVVHGAIGGASSELQGGSFTDGFVGAAARQAAAPVFRSNFVQQSGSVGRFAIAATIGGTASELTGGKFANGARAAAFSYALTPQGIRDAVDVAGKAWTAPNTLIGVAAGTGGYIGGWAKYALGGTPTPPTIGLGNNAIEFRNIPFGSGAVTLGNAIVYGANYVPSDSCYCYGANPPVNIGLHEQAHTYQAQALGPFYLPEYFRSGGIDYENPNRYERAANGYARGKSWWPGN